MSTSKATITFHDAHIPVLQDGEYEFTISQQVNSDFQANIAHKTIGFNVTGPRFQLNPNQIVSAYPPNSGKGDFMAVLPSLVLQRSTLPWERTPIKPGGPDQSDLPEVQNSAWLFLLLVDEYEIQSGKITEKNNAILKDLVDGMKFSPADLKSFQFQAEDLDHLPTQINCLSIDNSLITTDPSSLIPNTLSELQYLSYARIKNEPGEEPGEEHAVLLCNRLPKKGSNSTVYLVSLENCYDENFNFKGFPLSINSTTKTLPYLYKWKFHAFDDQLYCITENKADKINKSLKSDYDFSTIYEKVYIRTGEFTDELGSKPWNIKNPSNQLKVIEQLSKVPGSNFHELLSDLDGGFKPLSIPVTTEVITASGSLNLNYLNGAEPNPPNAVNSAYYRSPLAASPIELSSISNLSFTAGHFPKQASDLVLTINETDDHTYSAAFELGRITALDDVDFAKEFYQWKCEYAVAKRASLNPEPHSYLAVSDGKNVLELPKHVQDKFNSWKQLKNIPYRYLVPDPDLLPNESIRFFKVDQNWIKAFICGAFSIGHTIEVEVQKGGIKESLFSDELTKLMNFNSIQETDGKKTIEIDFPEYGFLINSFAVSGWPDYIVETTAVNINSKDPLKLIRRENLDVNIELFLYNSSFSELNFHLHPGKTHSGFLYENGQFTKESDTIIAEISPGLTNDGENGPYVVNISDLYTKLENAFQPTDEAKNFSIAVFAGKMLEGTPEVIFKLS